FLFLTCSGAHRDLPSFPTRRSSDLDISVPLFSWTEPDYARLKRSPCSFTLASTSDEVNTRSSGSSQPSTSSHSRGVETVGRVRRSEEHTSELQSRENLVCRLLLEKK